MNFVLLGLGYIAPRHLQAIKAVGGNLLAALDKHDVAGVLDSCFPDCDFFTEIEILDRHLELLKRQGVKIDYVVVTTPNYLHDSHIRFGLRHGAKVICEKPVVLRPHNLDGLMEWGDRINVILQLRLHPEIIKLKDHVDNCGGYIHKVNIDYRTPRGKWYYQSWKGQENKSGGICTNIGVHLFDMILWIFGRAEFLKVYHKTKSFAAGEIHLSKAFVQWQLSTERGYTKRKMTVNGFNIDFTNGFTDLHTLSYKEILNGNGFTLKDARPSIELCSML